MDENRNRWLQIRLSNVFVSMAIFGFMLAFVKWCLNQGRKPEPGEEGGGPFFLILLYVGLPLLAGAAIGALFGRPLAGAGYGCLGFTLLLLALMAMAAL